MIAVDQAEREILAAIGTAANEALPLAGVAGRVLAQTVTAERDQPPFDRSMMDGFAIAASDRREFRVAGLAAAGSPQQPLASAEDCVEIMTGAPVPLGANCVIPVERTRREGDQIAVDPEAQVAAGQFVHPRASDHDEGTQLLEAGCLLGAAEIAVLASAGLSEVVVSQRPSIAVVASGDELVDAAEPVAPHQVRRSNDYAVQSLLAHRQLATVTRVHVNDDAAEQTRVFGELLEQHDGLVLTGGVSMGRFDYIPKVLAALDVEVIFHKVRQRPGKPMWFGLSRQGQPVFALPGNPVSALVCARRYVVPALQKWLGQSLGHTMAKLSDPLDFQPELTLFMPATTAVDPGVVRPKPTNTSGDFTSLAGTSGIIELPAGQSNFEAGFEGRWFDW